MSFSADKGLAARLALVEAENRRLKAQLKSYKSVVSGSRRNIRRMLARKAASATSKAVPLVGSVVTIALESWELLELCRLIHSMDTLLTTGKAGQEAETVTDTVMAYCSKVSEMVLPE